MSHSTWGRSNPTGEWIVNLEIPEDLRVRALAPLWYILHRVVPVLAPMHRLRKAIISWGEYDANGQELRFNELEEMDGVDWTSLEEALRHHLSGEHRSAVSALFLELDTCVVSGGGEEEQKTWVENSAELQISFLAPELNPPVASVMYSTSIDVWLPVTYDERSVTRSNEAMSVLNLPRLEILLSELSALAPGKPELGQSRLYRSVLSTEGFSKIAEQESARQSGGG